MESDVALVIKKKVCILGAFGVGKTSLVRRFVSGLFSERYLATIGVTIQKKSVRVGSRQIEMIIWDIAGGLHEGRSQGSYLRGTAGYIIVGDGTRPETCHVTTDIIHFAADKVGRKPNILLLNKADLASDWCLPAASEQSLRTEVDLMMKTSAKTGELVETAFTVMAAALAAGQEEVSDGFNRRTGLSRASDLAP